MGEKEIVTRQQQIHTVKLDAAANDNWQLRKEPSPAASHPTFPLLRVTDHKNKKRLYNPGATELELRQLRRGLAPQDRAVADISSAPSTRHVLPAA